jgi:8-oxo-dGTP pyrophosphatase MutT (NUDIX family)
MELNSEVVTAPPRAAATVVMLRDTPDGLEVFLLKRHGNSDVLGGAYVFPGGKVDAADAGLAAHLNQSPAELHAALGEAELDLPTATSFYAAALREAFEESGVLFATGADTAQLQQAAALLRAGQSFGDMLAQLALQLDTRSVLPWSRWITPRMPSVSNKRFDTRFFVAAVPAQQTARHDDYEATESIWLAPRLALQQYWDGQISLAPPQIMSLAHLARHASVASVLTEAQRRLPPVILPESFDDNGMRVICYPGDERHPVAVRALPGPTRLHFRNRRFEPHSGFEGLFA